MPKKERNLSESERIEIQKQLKPIFLSVYQETSKVEGFPKHSVVPIVLHDDLTKELFAAGGITDPNDISYSEVDDLIRLDKDITILAFVDTMIYIDECKDIVCDESFYNEVINNQNTTIRKKTKSKAVVERAGGRINLYQSPTFPKTSS